jgi:hypothetical protein
MTDTVESSAPSRPASQAKALAKRPLLERAGVRFFAKRSGTLPPIEAGDAVHLLNAGERRSLRRIAHLCIARAAAVGAASAGICGLFDAVLFARLGLDPEATDTNGRIAYWVAMALVTGVTAVLEIGFLYWDALRSVHALSYAAGLDLFGGRREEREAVAAALARAALELPNSPEPVFGVDPRREIGKTRLVLVSLAYKAKVGVTNFLVKALIRRAAGRAIVRGLLSFVAVPVTAAWNAYVAWKVLREARIRVMGPSAAEDLADVILRNGGELTPLGRDTVVRAIGSAIVRTHDMHPNLEHLLVHVTEKLDEPPEKNVDDPSVFLDQLMRVSKDERLTAVRMLNVASIIDGRLTLAEQNLVKDALIRCGHPPTARYVKKLRRAFVGGDPIDEKTLLEVWA